MTHGHLHDIHESTAEYERWMASRTTVVASDLHRRRMVAATIEDWKDWKVSR